MKGSWSNERVSVVGHRPSGDKRANRWFDPASEDDDSVEEGKRVGCWICTLACCISLLIGCLVAGIALGVIIPLWLTSTGRATNKPVSTFSGQYHPA